ncbi:MAG: LON peptidase substrate-binding domain-containing protein [Acidimicrobiales bacterium]
MAIVPQFPLGTVLFPTMVLPLHIFEPRYREMAEQVTTGDGMFGVTLIERGSEVGGSEQRTDFGTLAKVVDSERLDDGRWALIAVGAERFRIERWLPDDPYPVAEISLWPDEDDAAVEDALAEPYDQVAATLRRCMALAAESGVDVGPVPDSFEGDHALGSMQMAALAPLGPLDKQRLLGVPTTAERLDLLATMLDDALELIRLRLTGQ